MALEAILSFFGASLLLALMPGPDNIFVLTESITKGQRNGVAIATGLNLGVLVHTTLAATGLSLLILQTSWAFTAIQFAGAGYLFYLAYLSTRESTNPITIDDTQQSDTRSLFSLLRQGFLMNVLNPKVSLFFIAFLPQFITPKGYHITVQMIVLGLIFMVQGWLVFSGIAVLAGRLSSYVQNPKFWIITKWIKVSILAILAVSLLFAEQ